MILQRYVLKELLITFLLTFFSLSLIILMGYSVQQLLKYEGVGLSILLKIAPYLTSSVAMYTLPVSVLISCIFVYKRMAQEFEIMAVQASGVSKSFIARPSLLLAIPVTILMIYLVGTIRPNARYVKQNIGVEDLSKMLTVSTQQKKVFNLDNIMFRFDRIQDGFLYGVHIMEMHKSNTPKKWIFASRGQFIHFPSAEKPTLEFALEGVTVTHWEDPTDRTSHQTVYFRDEPFLYTKNLRDQIGFEKRKLPDMTFSHLQMVNQRESLPEYLRPVEKDRIVIELMERYALALAPLIFVLIAVPIAMRATTLDSNHYLSLFGVLVLFIFYPLVISAKEIGNFLAPDPLTSTGYPLNFLAFFSPHLLLSIAAYFLMSK